MPCAVYAAGTLKVLPLLATAQRVGGLVQYLFQPLVLGDRSRQPARQDSAVGESAGEAAMRTRTPPDGRDQAGPSGHRPATDRSGGAEPSKRRRVS